ncbi:MAG TPA: HAD family hydrolase [Thermoplasmata archaeon]|nr:HAD family hydrolase [Thermoplasmata archaeon]
MAPFPYGLVTVDIDGTLTQGHGWSYLAERLGRPREYERTQEAFTSGAIGEDEHLANLLALAEGASRREVARILSETPRVAGIREAVQRLHGLGAHVALLTHNPSYICDWYRARFNIDASDGLLGSPRFRAGRVGAPGTVRADKLGGLERLATRFGVPPTRIAHVGDGAADASVFPLVGLGVAFGTQSLAVRAAADVVVEGRDLRRVVAALERSPPARG